MSMNLKPLLEPRSVAVIGASHNTQKPGGRAIQYLKNYSFPGHIIPINPNREEVAGIKCHASLGDLDILPDMAIIAVSANKVCETLEACQKIGIPAVTIYSSGFAEANDVGVKMQEKLQIQIAMSDTIVCGPNSQGVANFHHPMVAYFSSELGQKERSPGPIGFVGHSGVMGGIVARECINRGIGIGYLVSLGNEIDVGLSDIIEHVAMSEDISVIGAYVESVKNPERLKQSIQHARSRNVPIIILKGGKSEISSSVAASHTASIVGDWEVNVAALRQWGAIVVESIEELFIGLELFALCKKIPLGNKVGVLTNSGGIGVLCSDALDTAGLRLSKFNSNTEEALKKTLPPFASSQNPIDVTLQWLTNPEIISKQLQLVAADKNVDIVMPFPGVIRQHADIIKSQIISISEQIDKPMICGWFGGNNSDRISIREAGIPVYETPNSAASAASLLIGNTDNNNSLETVNRKSKYKNILNYIKKSGGILSEYQSKQILRSIGLTLLPFDHAKNIDDAIVIANKIGYPVAVKISSQDIQHKSDIGGVSLGVVSDDEIVRLCENMSEKIYNDFPDAKFDGFLVEKMASKGIELFIGMKRDPSLGPVIAFGYGGTMVEFINKKGLLIPPFSKKDIYKSIKSNGLSKIFEGYRGNDPIDYNLIIEVLFLISDLVRDVSRIKELEINPLIISNNHCYAVDAIISLEE